jgi:uncharacterized protein (TIGR02996 family)
MTPPPAHEPFLRAICEAPDDDAPRLVFADWLDETGDPDRAEFIRLHVRLARQPDAEGLERRCKDLFRWKCRAWTVALPGTVALWAELTATSRPPGAQLRYMVGGEPAESDYLDTWVGCHPSFDDWDRGFPTTIYIQWSSDAFFGAADRVTQFVPIRRLRVLNVDDPNPVMIAIAGTPFFRKIRDLILPSVALTDDAAVALASSPYATGLRYVSLVAERMTDRAGRAFAESPYLGGLEMLHLLHNDFNGSTKAVLRARFGFNVHC